MGGLLGSKQEGGRRIAGAGLQAAEAGDRFGRRGGGGQGGKRPLRDPGLACGRRGRAAEEGRAAEDRALHWRLDLLDPETDAGGREGRDCGRPAETMQTEAMEEAGKR
jgi:hypothetical protein